jgi:hypothetical protein
MDNYSARRKYLPTIKVRVERETIVDDDDSVSSICLFAKTYKKCDVY